MKHLRYLLMAALVALPLTACDEDDDPAAPVFGTISGTVSAEGSGLQGVTVTLIGAASQSATTDGSGMYSFANVEAGSYGVAIDPSTQPDVSFQTVAQSTAISTSGQTATVDFSGSFIRTSSITGDVTANGVAIGGLNVTVTGGPDNVNKSAVTSGGGTYVVSGLRAGTYTVTIPAVDGVNFTGLTAQVSVGTGETSLAHFPGQAVEMATITGAVTIDGVGVAAVVVTLSGGADATTETGAQGAYTFTNLTPGEYTVTITYDGDAEFADMFKTLVLAAGQTGVASFAGFSPAEPATISIGAMTRNDGGNVIPLDVTNVFGQIEITANIERNDQTLDFVDVLIGDVVVATQQFQIPASPAEMAGDQEVITLSVPTTQVKRNADDTAWIPAVTNGGKELSLNLYVVEMAGEPIPTNKVPIVMQNPDALIPGDDPGGNLLFVPDDPSMTAEGALNAGDNTWYAGTSTFSGPQFLSYTTETPATVAFASGCAASTQTIDGDYMTGIQVSNTYNCSNYEGLVWPNHNSYTVTYNTAVGPDGTAIMFNTPMSALGAMFNLSDGTVGPRRFVISNPIVSQIVSADSLNMDNKAPTVYVDGETGMPAAAELVAFRDMFDQPWINHEHVFVLFDGDGDIDTDGDVFAYDNGVGLDDAMTTALWYDWVNDLPGDLDDDCSLTTPLVTGDDLDETQASDGTPDGHQICAQASDLLGNTDNSGPSNFFGVDKVAPLIQAYRADPDTLVVAPYAPAMSLVDMKVFSAESADGSYDVSWTWGYDALDGRSGFDTDYWYDGVNNAPDTETFPARQSLMHYPGTGTAALACDQFDNTLTAVGGTSQFVRTTLVDFTCLADLVEPGYFVYDNMVFDRAGNYSTLGTATYAVDDVTGGAATSLPPTFDLLGFASTFYNPGQPADFDIWATDDLEVIEAEIQLVHPVIAALGGALTVKYGFGAIDAFMRFDGIDPYDNSLFSAAAIGQTVSTPLNVFGRLDYVCTAAGVPYANCLEDMGVTTDSTLYNLVLDDDFSMLPTAATGTVQDVGYNQTDLGAPINFIPAQWETATPAPWSRIAPGTIEVIIRRFYITEVTAGSAYTAVMEAPTSIEEPFFDAVALVNNDAGEITVCGLFTYDGDTDNGVDRFFNYTAGVAAGSACDGAVGTWHALGIKDDAGLVSQGL